jgi:hypothetical protein
MARAAGRAVRRIGLLTGSAEDADWSALGLLATEEVGLIFERADAHA